MKNIFFLLATSSILFFFAACSGPQPPVFVEMKNIKIDDIRNDEVFLTGDAVFMNPNPIAGKLVKTNLSVMVNDIEAGTAKQEVSVEINENSEFTVPVNINFPYSKILANKKGLVKGLLNALLDQKAAAHYTGSITVNFLKIDFEVPVNHEEDVSLKY